MSGPGSQWIGQEELKELMEVMESGYLFRYGNLDDPNYKHKVFTFENEFAEYCGVKHALATSSGTGALVVSLKAIGIEPGDEVIVPAYTFVATYSSVRFAGSVPVLAEIDESLNIEPNDIEHRITGKTKAIMPVHMLGNSCDMGAIMDIAKKHGLQVIEDVCQANGGIVVTDDTDLYKLAFGFHDQGHSPLRAGVELGARCSRNEFPDERIDGRGGSRPAAENGQDHCCASREKEEIQRAYRGYQRL
jgi:8-amino-3,8-dideoxy-alpha-D-manno-octulosonate transaminase